MEMAMVRPAAIGNIQFEQPRELIDDQQTVIGKHRLNSVEPDRNTPTTRFHQG
jgi:hypothetical protein